MLLRVPNPSNANNVRNVNPSGELNNNNANNGLGACVDCELYQFQVGLLTESSVLTCKEWLTCS